MPDERLNTYRNRSAAGGVNDRVFAMDIDETQSARLQNVDGEVPGQRRLRPGTSIVATGITNGPIYALHEYVPRAPSGEDSDLPTQLLAVSAGDSASDHKRLWRWDGSATQFTHIAALTGFTGSDEIQITTGLDTFQPTGSLEYVAVVSQQRHNIGAVGATFHYWNGTAIGRTAYGADDQPNSAPMAFSQGRGFGVGSASTRSRLYFSDVGTWTVTGFNPSVNGFEFGGRSRQRIVALHQFRSAEMIVFLEDKIEKLNTTEVVNLSGGAGAPFTNWSREVIDPEIGCGSRDSVTSVGKDLYFADQYGNIRSLVRTIQDSNQGAESLPVSSNIQSTIDKVSASAVKRIVCSGFNRFLFVGLPVDGSTTPNEVWRYDVVRRAWDGPWTNINPWSMAVATFPDSSANSRQNPQLYFGTSETSFGKVLQMDTALKSDPSDTGIVYQETTRRHVMGGLERIQSPQRVAIYSAPAGTVTLCVESNCDGMGFQVRGYTPLIGNAPLLPRDMPFQLGAAGIVREQFSLEDVGRCTDIQFRFTATATESVQILGYTYLSYVEPYDWDADT